MVVNRMATYSSEVADRYGSVDEFEVAIGLFGAERYLAKGIASVLDDYNMSRAQWSAMTVIHLGSDSTVPLGHIAQVLDVHGTTVTNAIDGLVNMGFVTRATNPKDRRSIFASLTPNGQSTIEEIMSRFAAERFALPQLSNTELRALLRILKKFLPE